MNCRICNREDVGSGYCELHKKAYENITRKYDSWKNALAISWKEYLSEVAKNPLVGEWAKEVAKHLIESGEEQNVTYN